MNTIQVTTNGAVINYTETEIIRFIEKAGDVDNAYEKLRTIRYNVRDFFSEGEWNNGEQTVQKSDVNELLERIGTNKLTTKYNANYTITGAFSIEVEDEDDVESTFVDNVSVDFYDGDIDVELIEVTDIEEEE
jgi:hypothetical protein